MAENQTGQGELASQPQQEILHLQQQVRNLRASLDLYQQLIDYSNDFISVHDALGVFLYASPASLEIFGYEPDQLIGRTAFEVIHPDDLQALTHNKGVNLNDSLQKPFVFRILQQDGGFLWVESVVRGIPSARTGEIERIYAVTRDIHDRLEWQEALQKTEKRFQGLVDLLPIGVFETSANARITYLNQAAQEMFGYTFAEALEKGLCVPDLFQEDDRLRMIEMFSQMHLYGLLKNIEVQSRRKDGSTFPAVIHSTLIDPQNAQCGMRGVFFDMTDRRQAEERIRYLSMHDSLTGLYNRAYFEEELERLQNSRHFPIGVVMIDVDGLKRTNDEFGHAAGDELLRRTARVLHEVFRQDDVTARIGGDEFAVLLPSTNRTDLGVILRRLRSTIESSNQKQSTPTPLSLSLGAAVGEAGDRLDQILQDADRAMYREKGFRRSQFSFAGGDR